MTDSQINAILDKLDRQDSRLDNIEGMISNMKVQDEKILNIQTQLSALWKKYDMAFSTDGIVAKITNHQASCPKDEVKDLKSKVFGMLISIVLMVLSGLSGILFFAFRS